MAAIAMVVAALALAGAALWAVEAVADWTGTALAEVVAALALKTAVVVAVELLAVAELITALLELAELVAAEPSAVELLFGAALVICVSAFAG